MTGLVPPLLLIPAFSALMPIFAADIFKAGPEGLGLMLSAVGVGGIVGGVAAAWTTRYDRTGLVQTLALVVFGASLFCFALAPTIEFALFWLAIAGIAEMVHFTIHVTTLQMCAPEHMRGRVASLLPVFPAFISVGAFIAGASADRARRAAGRRSPRGRGRICCSRRVGAVGTAEARAPFAADRNRSARMRRCNALTAPAGRLEESPEYLSRKGGPPCSNPESREL